MQEPASSPKKRRQPAPGIALRHRRACATRSGGACTCRPAYQAQAWSAGDGKPIRRTFRALADARDWRSATQVALRRGEIAAPSGRTLAEACRAWLDGARSGAIRTRSGHRYKPSVIRGYEIAVRTKLEPALGSQRLSALTRTDLQDLVDELVARGYAPASVRNAVMLLRAIYRRALTRGEVPANSTRGLEFPANEHRRDRVASPEEARALLDALPERDRALWATAIYAGLRRGELQALRWSDVDLDACLISVEHGWDRVAGLIEPKSRCSVRRVPVPKALRLHLLAHRLRQGSTGGFVFSASGERPFDPATIAGRAHEAWSAARRRTAQGALSTRENAL